MKHLPNTAKYSQHLEIHQVLMAVLAMDTVGHLPVTSNGHQWALTVICMPTSYVCTISKKDKSAENVMQAHLSNMFAPIVGSIAILSEIEQI